MTIYINSFATKGPQNLTILQYLKFNGYDVPRFCFHEKLDIAGNCRMCLVEVDGINKPIASCTVKVTDNLSIFTNSVMVRKARQAVLEALLLSHPLDCPICDQGGECDLQDQTLLYGPDRGRFFTRKKSVYDFNLGPFVKTTMTRCINCTRCVRFVDLVGKSFNKEVSSLGHVGRGSEVYIGQYLSRLFINNDLSGNLIDLCPVGALTSKTYSFTARPWEAASFETFDIFDTLLQSIRVDIRDNKILRILPTVDLTPSLFFSEWLTDLSRFSHDGYFSNRLKTPMKVDYKNNIFFVWRVSWDFVFSNLLSYNTFFPLNISLILGDFLDLELLTTISLLNKFYKNKLGNSLDIIYSGNGIFNEFPFFDFRFEYFSGYTLLFQNVTSDTFFFSLGIDLRLEMPIYNLILRQRLKHNYDTNILGLGFKSIATNNIISNNLKEFITLCEGKSYVCHLLKKVSSNVLIYGNSIYQRYDNFSFYYLLKSLNSLFPFKFFNTKSVTFLNSFDLGLHEVLYNVEKKKRHRKMIYLVFILMKHFFLLIIY